MDSNNNSSKIQTKIIIYTIIIIIIIALTITIIVIVYKNRLEDCINSCDCQQDYKPFEIIDSNDTNKKVCGCRNIYNGYIKTCN